VTRGVHFLSADPVDALDGQAGLHLLQGGGECGSVGLDGEIGQGLVAEFRKLRQADLRRGEFISFGKRPLAALRPANGKPLTDRGWLKAGGRS
jgi:hypothetical protein